LCSIWLLVFPEALIHRGAFLCLGMLSEQLYKMLIQAYLFMCDWAFINACSTDNFIHLDTFQFLGIDIDMIVKIEII
jgi:hypothetical protein